MASLQGTVTSLNEKQLSAAVAVAAVAAAAGAAGEPLQPLQRHCTATWPRWSPPVLLLLLLLQTVPTCPCCCCCCCWGDTAALPCSLTRTASPCLIFLRTCSRPKNGRDEALRGTSIACSVAGIGAAGAGAAAAAAAAVCWELRFACASCSRSCSSRPSCTLLLLQRDLSCCSWQQREGQRAAICSSSQSPPLG